MSSSSSFCETLGLSSRRWIALGLSCVVGAMAFGKTEVIVHPSPPWAPLETGERLDPSALPSGTVHNLSGYKGRDIRAMLLEAANRQSGEGLDLMRASTYAAFQSGSLLETRREVGPLQEATLGPLPGFYASSAGTTRGHEDSLLTVFGFARDAVFIVRFASPRAEDVAFASVPVQSYLQSLSFPSVDPVTTPKSPKVRSVAGDRRLGTILIVSMTVGSFLFVGAVGFWIVRPPRR